MDEAKEDAKSMETALGGVERPELGVYGPKLESAYEEPVALDGGSSKAWLKQKPSLSL